MVLNSSSKEPAIAFARKGYHILLEKPMAVSDIPASIFIHSSQICTISTSGITSSPQCSVTRGFHHIFPGQVDIVQIMFELLIPL